MSQERTFSVGSCLVEQDLDRICRGEHVVTVRPQVMEVLVYLASNSGNVVDAEELLDSLWPGKVVTSASIYNCMSELRSAFHDCDPDQVYLETVPRKGYRLVAPVIVEGGRRIPLNQTHQTSRLFYSRRASFVLFAVVLSALFVGLLTHQFRDDFARLGPRSMIVLPFTTSADEDSIIYADGILGELLAQLHRIDGVTMVGRATAMRFRGSNEPIRSIAEEVGVAMVLSGSLVESGNQRRLDLELLNARTGVAQWADSFELTHATEDLFIVYSEIAARVAHALDLQLNPPDLERRDEAQAATDAAYNHYLRGQVFGQSTRLEEAINEYRLATREDPLFAAAWAALARAAAEASYLGIAGITEQEAEFALELARQLAPDSVATLYAQAEILNRSPTFDEAEAIYKEILRREAGWIDPVIALAGIHTVRLRLEEARTLAERAVLLDPRNIGATWQMAFVLAWSWRFDESRLFYDRTLALEPGNPDSWRYWMRYEVYLWGLGDMGAARRILDEAPPALNKAPTEVEFAYVNRNWAELENLLGNLESTGFYRNVMDARMRRIRGDVELQMTSAAAARLAAEASFERMLGRGAPQADIEGSRSRAAVALALGHNEEEALRTIRIAVENVEADLDRLNTVPVYYNEILTYVFLDKHDVAIQRLRQLLSWAKPHWLTPHRLRIDPDFDDLRDQPDFLSLLRELDSGLKQADIAG